MENYRTQMKEVRDLMWKRYNAIEKTGDELEKSKRHEVHRQWCRDLLELVERKNQRPLTLPFSKEEVDKSGDTYLNDLPLAQWDNHAQMLINLRLVNCLSDGVCILKEKARLRSGR